MDFSSMTATTVEPEVIDVEVENIEKQLPVTVDEAQAYKERLKQLPEVQNLTSELDLGNLNSIIMFGSKPAVEVSKVSDEILRNLKSVKTSEATDMINQLTTLMDKFDIGDMKDIERMEQEALEHRRELMQEKSSRKQRKLQKLVDKIMEKFNDLITENMHKYENFEKEIDVINQKLCTYKNQLQESTTELSKLRTANMKFYQTLEKYIAAGELGVKEIEDQKSFINSNMDFSPEQKAQYQEQLNMFQELLERRIMDLRTSEAVAMQTNPILQSMLTSNNNLQVTITSAFITTLPVFKQCLIQSVFLKRDAVISVSMNALADETNKLMLRNADMNSQLAVKTLKQATTPQIKVDTLQKSYETIKKGIEATKQIEAQNKQQRIADTATLENMKHNMKSQGWA